MSDISGHLSKMANNEAARILVEMEISAQLSEGELDMPELDGTAKHHEFVTPFDAHDKVLRTSNNDYQEFPRVREHVQKTDGPVGHCEVVLEEGEE